MKILDPLLQKYNINVMLHGHDHNYERSFPVNGGAATSNQIGSLSDPFVAHAPFSGDQVFLDTIHIVVGTGGTPLRKCRAIKVTSSSLNKPANFCIFDILL